MKYTTQKTLGQWRRAEYRTIVSGTTRPRPAQKAIIKPGETISATVCTKAPRSDQVHLVAVEGQKFKL
jgi:hypothetical protein